MGVGDEEVAMGIDTASMSTGQSGAHGRAAVAVVTLPSAGNGDHDAGTGVNSPDCAFSVSTTITLSFRSQRIALGAPQVAARAGPPSPV